jgi:adenosylmethionine-8-amino-7-oxononanoate aminotransferase
VTPDILVGGKGLASGYAPMGGIFASESVVAPVIEQGQEFMFFTYSAHPASCAAAEKVLEILEREQLVERAARMGEILGKRLARLLDHPNVGDVRGRGLLWAWAGRGQAANALRRDRAHRQDRRGGTHTRRLRLPRRRRPRTRRDHLRPAVHHLGERDRADRGALRAGA